MIQRSQQLPKIRCACGRCAQLITTLGRVRYHVECAPCERRTAKHEDSADAIQEFNRLPTAGPSCAPSPIPDSGAGAAVISIQRKKV